LAQKHLETHIQYGESEIVGVRKQTGLLVEIVGTAAPCYKNPGLTPEEYGQLWSKLTQHIPTAASTLRHFKDDLDAEVYADASGHSLGVAVIQQGNWWPSQAGS
jgi:hypothetical protein